MIKKLFESALQKPAFLKFVHLLESIDSRRPNLVRVLTYHQIEDAQGFAQQMEFLAKNFYVANMDELIDVSSGHSTLPPKSVVITFDDAYRSFEEYAWPILKSHSLPVTLFVPTAFPDHKEKVFWWDKLENAVTHSHQIDLLQTPFGPLPIGTVDQRTLAYKRLRQYVKSLPHEQALSFVDQVCQDLSSVFPPSKVMTWDALRRLAGEGVTLGAHTQTHPLMNRISLREACEEVIGSMKDLQREIGATSPVFAYPDGQYTQEVVQVVKDAGIQLAFTTQPGTNDMSSSDHLRMRRNNLDRRANQPMLRAKLLQATVYLDRFRPVQNG